MVAVLSRAHRVNRIRLNKFQYALAAPILSRMLMAKYIDRKRLIFFWYKPPRYDFPLVQLQ